MFVGGNGVVPRDRFEVSGFRGIVSYCEQAAEKQIRQLEKNY